MKRLIYWLWRFLILFIILGLTSLWLLQTNSGAKVAISLVNSFTSIDVQYGELNGDVASLKIDNLKVVTSALDIEAQQITLNWNPFKVLFRSQVQIETFTADQMYLRPKKNASEASSSTSNDWRLPIYLDIQSAQINGLKIEGVDQQAIDTLFFAATFEKNQWTIKELNIKYPQLEASLNGTLVPYDEFTHKLSLRFKSPEIGEGTLIVDGNATLSNLTANVPQHKFNLNTKLLNWISIKVL